MGDASSLLSRLKEAAREQASRAAFASELAAGAMAAERPGWAAVALALAAILDNPKRSRLSPQLHANQWPFWTGCRSGRTAAASLLGARDVSSRMPLGPFTSNCPRFDECRQWLARSWRAFGRSWLSAEA